MSKKKINKVDFNALKESNLEPYIEYLISIADSINAFKVTILTGRNAGGKSLIRKLLNDSIAKQHNLEKLIIPHCSQELRTKSNPEMGGLSGMTHDLEWLATSDSTIHMIEQVIKRKAKYVVIDEPEIGLGDELKLGLCDFLNKAIKTNTDLKGCLIITHSKDMVRNIKHDAFFNLEGMTEKEWLDREIKAKNIDEFKDDALTLFKAVRVRINNNKAKK